MLMLSAAGACAAYLVLAVIAFFLCREGSRCRELSVPERLALLLPLALHAISLSEAMARPAGVNFTMVNALSLLAWLTVAVYWFAGLYHGLRAVFVLLLPAAAAAVMLPVLFPSERLLLAAPSVWFQAHFVVAFLAYSLLTVAALHAALVLVVEHRLHDHLPLRSGTPPVLTLEAMLFQILWAGFALLTLTLLSGAVFWAQADASVGHKVVFALASWLVFGTLLAGRLRYGWRGRFAARWTLTGFALLLLAYVGTKFVLEVLLGRI